MFFFYAQEELWIEGLNVHSDEFIRHIPGKRHKDGKNVLEISPA